MTRCERCGRSFRSLHAYMWHLRPEVKGACQPTRDAQTDAQGPDGVPTCDHCQRRMGTCGNCGQIVCFECHDRDACTMG